MTDFHYMFKCVFFTCERCNHQNLFFLLDSKWCVLRTACFKKRAIQQLSLLWTETYQYRNFRSIQYELQRWESKKCIVPIQICIKMWSIMGCACCHGFEWISCFSGARASFFFYFLLFPFSYQWQWSDFSDAFLRYNYICWAFHCFMTPVTRSSCTAMLLSSSLGQLSYCLGAISVPLSFRQWEWSLPLKKGGIYGEIMVKPTH